MLYVVVDVVVVTSCREDKGPVLYRREMPSSWDKGPVPGIFYIGDGFLSPEPDIENGCHCRGRSAMTGQGVKRSMCRIVGIGFCPWHSGDMVSVPLQVRCSTLLSGSLFVGHSLNFPDSKAKWPPAWMG